MIKLKVLKPDILHPLLSSPITSQENTIYPSVK